MTTQNVETVNQQARPTLVIVAVAVDRVAGVLRLQLPDGQQPMVVRLGVLLGGLVAGVAIAWFSQPGKRFLAFARESYEEASASPGRRARKRWHDHRHRVRCSS